MAQPRAHTFRLCAVATALLAACSSYDSPPGATAAGKGAAPSSPSNGGAGGACGPFTPSWWDAGYGLRRQLTITASGNLAAGYSVGLSWNSSADVSAGRMLASGDDVRVVYFDGSAHHELHRHLLKMNSGSTELWFKTQAAVNGTSTAYWLYFRNAAPAAPLAAWSDAMAGTSPVYLSADSFESYASGAQLVSGGAWQGSTAYTVQADPKDASNKVAKVQGPGGGRGAYIFAGDFAWTDVALRARYLVGSTSATYMGFVLHAENASPFQFLYSGYSSPTTEIQFWNCSLASPTSTSLAASSQLGGAGWVTASNDGSNWHDHLLSVRGSRVRHSIDGTEWFPAAYPTNGFNANSIPNAGRIGLLKGYDNSVSAYYDDVIVRAYVEPEPTVSAGVDEVGCDACAGVTCTALDACHDVGTCNPATGLCSNPVKPENEPCSDDDACTRTDQCKSGVCTGSNPVVCTAPDTCHAPGTCDPTTGICSAAIPKAENASCDDGNACTQTDQCKSGVCTGANPVVCTAPNACHEAGTCDTATGACSAATPKAEDTPCEDSNACTRVDLCKSGVCTGTDPVVCTAPDACHDPGTCNTATGVCGPATAKAEGEPCDDGNACTRADTCLSGVCVGANPVVCAVPDPCHAAGVCDPTTGVCSHPPRDDGTACSDGDACTKADTCQAGVCTGSDRVVCTAPDACHDAGACDPLTGECSAAAAKPEGSSCDDGDACTRVDSCQSGICVGGNPVVCSALDPCHVAGTCDPSTGLCSSPAKDDGSACDDADPCTTGERCLAGICSGGQARSCEPPDECQVGSCGASGECGYTNRPDGTACADGRGTCESGSCKSPGKQVTFDVGCGCAAAGASPGLLPLALVAVLAATRRRAWSRRAPVGGFPPCDASSSCRLR